ncbi:hypothetical protein G9464_20190 [Halostella sp. JP-L12]|uniref:hypothetical protein n=1 Tax=Halostella TaxID=1843185 RepID=UPI000EF768E6|nr:MULTISPECIES: hypothetical protein [Halostella]NHN49892.1 hypothetical protein [Halostella sp. JP-L12]
MPDENRFAGIGDAVEEEPENDDAAIAEEPSAETGEETVADAGANDGEDDTGGNAAGPAAFAFDDTVQKSVYVRPETFEELEDAEALVNAQLRTEHDLKDLTRREFFDAVFREAAEDTDRLVERIRKMREK